MADKDLFDEDEKKEDEDEKEDEGDDDKKEDEGGDDKKEDEGGDDKKDDDDKGWINGSIGSLIEDRPGNNIVTNNLSLPVMPAFNFVLRVEGLYDIPCKSIRGLRKENEFEYIQEGGLNDYVHLKRKPISKPFTFQVERYAGTDTVDVLELGTELTLPLMLFVYDRPLTSNFLDAHRVYTFTGCTVISKEYGDLNAETSALLTETVTIAFRELVCVNTVWSTSFRERDRM